MSKNISPPWRPPGRHIKPEFLTSDLANLSLIAQYINYFDPDRLAEFFQSYLMQENQTHIKQRSRLAPEKSICIEKLTLIRETATTSWHLYQHLQLGPARIDAKAKWVGDIAKDTGSIANGYACLGYYIRFFEEQAAEKHQCAE